MTTDRRDFDSLIHDFNDHEAFGIDFSSLPTDKRLQLAKQDAFLAAYANAGTIYRAAPAASITRRQVLNWRTDDALGFRARFELAQRAFAESLEDLAMQRILEPAGNRGSDVLLMAMLNAHLPEKYRPNVVLSDESSKDVLKELQQIRKGQKTQEAEVPENVTAIAKMAR